MAIKLRKIVVYVAADVPAARQLARTIWEAASRVDPHATMLTEGFLVRGLAWVSAIAS